MHNYCTLFDSNYIHKGLALYQSLRNVCDEFNLFVVAFDVKCYNTLKGLNLPMMTVISLVEFETEELLSIKSTRTSAEYCWTCGSSVIYHCIQYYKLDHCTYLDADLMFYSSPDPIYFEIGDNSTAISEHYTDGQLEGRFCVQFVYFKNDADGMEALTWWKNKCIEWCYARYEDGKFGDQKYLDYFPTRFKNVHIIEHRGAGVAPWNVQLYSFIESGKIRFDNLTIDIIFFHYHGTKIDLIDNNLQIKVITSDVDQDLEKQIYIPYLELIKSINNIYLGNKIVSIQVLKRSSISRIYFKIKKIFRYNRIFQFVYYKIFLK